MDYKATLLKIIENSHWLKNKFFLAGLAFLIWMIFFDIKDIPSTLERRSKLIELQKSEKHSIEEIAKTQNELMLLKTNVGSFEKYAREHYYMKKDNEDLFIVNEKLENSK